MKTTCSECHNIILIQYTLYRNIRFKYCTTDFLYPILARQNPNFGPFGFFQNLRYLGPFEKKNTVAIITSAPWSKAYNNNIINLILWNAKLQIFVAFHLNVRFFCQSAAYNYCLIWIRSHLSLYLMCS